MKKNLFRLKYLFLFILLSFFSTEIVSANQTPVQFTNPLRAENFEELINLIIGFLWAMAIPLAVLIITLGAFHMVTSVGDPKKFETGKKVIFYAFIGLIVIIIAQSFIPFIRGFFEGL